MAITYTWAVVHMDATPTPETDVVINVHWTLTGEEAGLTGYVYGSIGIERNENAPLAPYSDLTKDQVIGWVQAAMGKEQVAAYEANVAQQIADKVSPAVVSPELPWA